MRCDKSKLYRENQLLKKQLEATKRKADMPRKRVQRMDTKFSDSILKTSDIELPPKLLTQKTVHECYHNGFKYAEQKVAKNPFLHIVMSAAIKSIMPHLQQFKRKKFKLGGFINVVKISYYETFIGNVFRIKKMIS
ncbi:unnamed protein product [Larinioides sclopetarius]|uniref:Uncharacterized protein n=1 Tax=Larinioides sclopetarius TaxID=280406 RepID=A0AAV2B8J5_9ARAC